MKTPTQKLTLSVETLRKLNAPPPDSARPGKPQYPTTTVLTKFASCTAC